MGGWGGEREQIRTSRKMSRWVRLAHKGWTIRKLIWGGGGGGGEVPKIYSRKAKLNEKKFMHAN